jgi:hypothetical protein
MPFDKEKARRNLKEILDKMQNDTDTASFLEYFKLYKKEISFFKRSWAAAWLFMYYDGKEIPRLRSSSPAQSTVHAAVQSAVQKPKAITSKNDTESALLDDDSSAEKTASLAALPEEESKRLFISIGKNRRLFPREVITLIMTNSSAVREDIGIIRILDNYSFVQVRDEKADEIIEKLTGHRFRGRTLTVNYAKPKTSEENSE